MLRDHIIAGSDNTSPQHTRGAATYYQFFAEFTLIAGSNLAFEFPAAISNLIEDCLE
jgi:hypothetical protein